MEIVYIDNLSEYKNNSGEIIDVSIGFFDAVHLGHKRVLDKLCQSENKKAVITFENHPNKEAILSIDSKLAILNTEFKLDYVYILKYNEQNMNSTKEMFIDFLSELNVAKIDVGADFKFGKDACGNVEDLKEKFALNLVDFLEDDNQKISSSNLRVAIKNGDLEYYKLATGRNYFLIGNVVMGDQIGRTINFPTANLQTDDMVISGGVYVSEVEIDNRKYQAVTNVGMRPTISGKKLQIESHIFDFNDIIYNKCIKVSFLKLIRHEMKFASLEELKMQIEKDKMYAKGYYGN